MTNTPGAHLRPSALQLCPASTGHMAANVLLVMLVMLFGEND